jgi:magnesium-transporting ATPase (P-type)
MKEGLIKDTYELILKEIQTVLTISYLLIVGIGMLFTHQKYSEFGINIFEYADIFEFLIAPFSDFKILLFSTITITAVLLLCKLDDAWKRKYPKTYSKMNFGFDKKNWFRIYRYFLIAFTFIYYLYLSADFYGKFTKNEILGNSKTVIKYSDNEFINGIIIGKTKDILFLLQKEKVKAIPINSNVKEFEIK